MSSLSPELVSAGATAICDEFSDPVAVEMATRVLSAALPLLEAEIREKVYRELMTYNHAVRTAVRDAARAHGLNLTQPQDGEIK